MDQITHSFVPANGVDFHIAEAGSGPAILLLHGFPEIWYSWRHQMVALANAGFRAIAVDHRGYGLTKFLSKEEEEKQTDHLTTVEDVVALVDALRLDKVFVVAKDWAVFSAYCFAFLHPHRVLALAVFGGPFFHPLKSRSRPLIPDGHYIKRWRQPGVLEDDFAVFDVATIIRRVYILFCNREMPLASPDQTVLELVKSDEALPSWMSEEDLKAYVELYEKSGFEHAIQVPYRSFSRTVEKFAQLEDLTIHAPVLLMMGEDDYALQMNAWKSMPLDLLPQARVAHIKGGHFAQEQFPHQTTELLISFFALLAP